MTPAKKSTRKIKVGVRVLEKTKGLKKTATSSHARGKLSSKEGKAKKAKKIDSITDQPEVAREVVSREIENYQDEFQENKEAKRNKSDFSSNGNMFNDTFEEEKKSKKRKIIPTPTAKIYSKIAVSFIILTIALLVIIFYFSIARVSITIIPRPERISDTLIFDVFDSSKNLTTDSDAVAGIVKSTKVEQAKDYKPTGLQIIGEEAVGKVTMINNYTKNQPLVATTRLLAPDNKLFRLKNTINVPAGGSMEVEVYADKPSPDMAVGPTKFTIPGLWAGLQDKIYAESNEPMKYEQKVKRYIEQLDIDNAVKDLKQILLSKNQDDIEKTYKVFSQVIYQLDENSISQAVDGKIGDETEKFRVTIQAQVTIVAFNDSKILELAREKLMFVMPDDKDLIEFDPQAIIYSVDNFDLNKGIASVKASFAGEIVLNENAGIIERGKLVGLKKDQLEIYLLSLPEIEDINIEFSPSWVKKTPGLVDRIKIKIEK